MRNSRQARTRKPAPVSAPRRLAAIVAVAAAVAPGLTAQTAASPASVTVQTIPFSGSLNGCPVLLAARQRSASALREVPGSLSGIGHKPRQGVTLTMDGMGPAEIVSAEIVIHGLSATTRALAVDGRPEADVTRTFHLFNTATGSLTSDVWMAGVSSLRWIELKSITYADGSEWHESKASTCGIAPDPVVLVSAR